MLKKITTIAPLAVLALSVTACSNNKLAKTGPGSSMVDKNSVVKTGPQKTDKRYTVKTAIFKPKRHQRRRNVNNNFSNKLSSAALERLRHHVYYNGSYVKIAYPWGDVPANMGVCTDVVIRSYRKLGIDLQQQIHQDMSRSFNAYPNLSKWGLSHTDTNIDHRRVYNMRTFFKRQGAALPITHNPRDYKPGDLVTWMVGPDLPHIGIVVNRRSKADPRRHMIVHNIANGPEMEDVLFSFRITGHYRYTPAQMKNLGTGRMLVSNSRKQQKTRHDYSQLVNDAARLMKIHGIPGKQTAKHTKTPRVVSLSNTTNNTENKTHSVNTIKLAQAKLGNLTSDQISDLLK